MKLFISSVAVFLILSTLVAVNAVVVCDYTERLIAETENLPEEPNDASSDRLLELWFQYESILNLTVSHTTTDAIERDLYELKNSRDAVSYAANRDTLLSRLRDLKSTAGLSLDRII